MGLTIDDLLTKRQSPLFDKGMALYEKGTLISFPVGRRAIRNVYELEKVCAAV